MGLKGLMICFLFSYMQHENGPSLTKKKKTKKIDLHFRNPVSLPVPYNRFPPLSIHVMPFSYCLLYLILTKTGIPSACHSREEAEARVCGPDDSISTTRSYQLAGLSTALSSEGSLRSKLISV